METENNAFEVLYMSETAEKKKNQKMRHSILCDSIRTCKSFIANISKCKIR